MNLFRLFRRTDKQKPQRPLSMIAMFCLVPFVIYILASNRKDIINPSKQAVVKDVPVAQGSLQPVGNIPDKPEQGSEVKQIDPFFTDNSTINKPIAQPSEMSSDSSASAPVGKKKPKAGRLGSFSEIMNSVYISYKALRVLSDIMNIENTVLRDKVSENATPPYIYASCSSVSELDIEGYDKDDKLFLQNSKLLINQSNHKLVQGVLYLPLSFARGDEIEAQIPPIWFFKNYKSVPNSFANVGYVAPTDKTSYKFKLTNVYDGVVFDYRPKVFFIKRTFHDNVFCNSFINLTLTVASLESAVISKISKSLVLNTLNPKIQIFLLNMSYGDEVEVLLKGADLSGLVGGSVMQDAFYALNIKVADKPDSKKQDTNKG